MPSGPASVNVASKSAGSVAAPSAPAFVASSAAAAAAAIWLASIVDCDAPTATDAARIRRGGTFARGEPPAAAAPAAFLVPAPPLPPAPPPPPAAAAALLLQLTLLPLLLLGGGGPNWCSGDCCRASCWALGEFDGRVLPQKPSSSGLAAPISKTQDLQTIEHHWEHTKKRP